MSGFDDLNTAELLARISAGDSAAQKTLFERHRSRLRRMVAVRMDRRLFARVDPSDVVQETLLEAARQLRDYSADQALPFYPWLRQLAFGQLRSLYRRHVQAQKRSVRRELQSIPLPDPSAQELVDRLTASATSPSGRMIRGEQKSHLRKALQKLPDADREVLVMRQLEELSMAEIAAVLGLTEGAVKSRHRRALQRLLDAVGGNITRS